MGFPASTSEPFTTKDFFALDVDEKVKVELIGGTLTVSPSTRPWHGITAMGIADALRAPLGSAFVVFLDLDVTVAEDTVVRPDVFVLDGGAYDPDRISDAADVVLAVEIVSPGSKIQDRRVKPELYREAGIPFWRVERSGQRLFLVESGLSGDEQTHFGTAVLRVAGIEVNLDLDAIAADALGKPED